MYRKDPRFSQDRAVSTLQKIIQDFDPVKLELEYRLEDLIELVETIEDSDEDSEEDSDEDSDEDTDEEPPQNETLTANKTLGNEENRRVIVCQSFSDDNEDVDVSSCRRIIKFTDKEEYGVGYCFLNHPKIEKDQVLQWTVCVPKFHKWSDIGMVITNEYKNFNIFDITF